MSDQGGSGAPGTMDQVRRYGPAVGLTAVAALFVFQNTNEARFDFLWFNFTWPLWVMLVVFAVVGALVMRWAGRRRRRA